MTRVRLAAGMAAVLLLGSVVLVLVHERSWAEFLAGTGTGCTLVVVLASWPRRG